MTGFGKAVCELPDKSVTIEIRSLNSKGLDIITKFHPIIRDKELEIRGLLQSELERGKVDINISYELKEGGRSAKLNKSVIKDYILQLNSITNELNIHGNENLFQTIMRLPDVFTVEKDVIEDEQWKQIKKSLGDAISQLNDFRKQEGAGLYTEIKQRINNILDLLTRVDEYEKPRIDNLKERINKSLLELGKEHLDENRFEQELIYYLEKFDITEEKVRLRNHCNYFLETMATNEQVGKKLGFIGQEIGREINTLGSKANQSDLQRIVVLMKDELEKIKEQVLNVL